MADLVKIGSVERGRHVPHFGQRPNGSLVAQRELVGAHVSVLVGHGWNGPVIHQDHVVAKAGQLFVLP